MGDGFLLLQSTAGLGQIMDMKYLIQDSDQTMKLLNVLKMDFNNMEMKVALYNDRSKSDGAVFRSNRSEKDEAAILNNEGSIAKHLAKLNGYGDGSPIIDLKKSSLSNDFKMWQIGCGYLTIEYDRDNGAIKTIKYIIIDSNRSDYTALNLKDANLDKNEITIIIPEADK
jgi:hypothetical protein